jgi:hypothetical protein
MNRFEDMTQLQLSVYLKNNHYKEYLNSGPWKQFKSLYKSSGLSLNCNICNKHHDATFNFHHKTYERFGCEELSDVVPVCGKCHGAIHKFCVRSGFSIWEATEKLKEARAISFDAFNELLYEPRKQKKKPSKNKERRRLARELHRKNHPTDYSGNKHIYKPKPIVQLSFIDLL